MLSSFTINFSYYCNHLHRESVDSHLHCRLIKPLLKFIPLCRWKLRLVYSSSSLFDQISSCSFSGTIYQSSSIWCSLQFTCSCNFQTILVSSCSNCSFSSLLQSQCFVKQVVEFNVHDDIYIILVLLPVLKIV